MTFPVTPPAILDAVTDDVDVVALPVSAPTKVVDVTVDNPANDEVVAPRGILVEPMVTELFVRPVFGIPVKFVPVNVGVFVQLGVVPDTRTWLDVPAANIDVVDAAD